VIRGVVNQYLISTHSPLAWFFLMVLAATSTNWDKLRKKGDIGYKEVGDKGSGVLSCDKIERYVCKKFEYL
jgi:hypothetical protein